MSRDTQDFSDLISRTYPRVSNACFNQYCQVLLMHRDNNLIMYPN